MPFRLLTPTIAIVVLSSPTAFLAAEEFVVTHRTTVFEHAADDPKAPENTSGFNHAPSVVQLADGRLLAAWYTSPREGDSSQRIVQSVSKDQGRTWSEPETLQDFPNRADFDPTFVVDGQSTFLLFSADSPLNGFMRRSDDSGKTWTEPVDLKQPSHTFRSNGIRLISGELLVPLHRRGTKAGGVLKSIDQGRSWVRFGNVMNPAGQGGEPSIAQLKSGKILMMLRTTDGELWCSQSEDQGETWRKPWKTRLTGTSSASHLLTLRDGRLVLTHNPGPVPLRFPLVMRLSRNEGKNWGSPFTLADRLEKTPGWQVSYPSLIELDDGTLLAVWARLRGSGNILFGDIEAARIRIE